MSGHSPLLVLLVFYLYLLVRWQHVRRPMCFLLGTLGLLFAMAGAFFTLGQSTMKVAIIFQIIGGLVAFVCAVGACYGAELPIQISSKLGGMSSAGTTPPAATTQTPPGSNV